MKIYSYRGDHEHLPENTMMAFRQALLNGAEGIALDVLMTRDHQPIVFRDEALGIATDAIGLVRHHDLSEIQEAEFNEPYTKLDQHIPSLKEYLTWAEPLPHTTILMVKNAKFPYSNFEEDLMNCLADVEGKERLLLACSRLSSLRLLHTRYPDIALGLIPDTLDEEIIAKLEELEIHYVLPTLTQTTRQFVELCNAHEMQIMTQDVSTPEQMQRLQELGVKSILVTDMATARAALDVKKMPYSAEALKFATETEARQEKSHQPMQSLAQKAKNLTNVGRSRKGKGNFLAVALCMVLSVAVATFLAGLFMNLMKGVLK